MTFPQYSPVPADPPPSAPRAGRKLPLLLGVGGGVLVLVVGIAIGAAADDSHSPAVAATPSSTSQTIEPSAVEPTTPATVATTAAPVVQVTTATPKPKPTKLTFKKVTDREWKKIAKAPDVHAGETIVVYGTVTQFDAATGLSSFRANVGPKNEGEPYLYETNTMLEGSAVDLTDLVEDDEFRANVRVMGSYSYSTQIGGETTVPQLEVLSIKVL